ncbi:MAG: DUF3397 domain-containing protein [Kurthia sp.]|nr:DUF3397 domain-containing protein [Candidatus Kurthia equi]
MVSILLWIGDICLICPWIIWGILFVVLKKIKHTKQFAFHFASDITTIFLLFAIRKIMLTLFTIDLGLLVWIAAVILAICMLVYEWKTKDELELKKVLKKIWRILFVASTIIYIGIVLAFCIIWIVDLFN